MILAILQARMSSTRLPGKVLMPIQRQPMIVRQIERVARARRIDKLVVATSDRPEDDAIETAMRREGIAVFRGSLDNVQQRFIGALDAHPADHVVRLTADCPLSEGECAAFARRLLATAGPADEVVVWAGRAPLLVANPGEVDSIHRIPVSEFLRLDAPRLENVATSLHPVLRMPVGHTWIAAPTAAVLYQFREVCLRGLPTRVSHFEQPAFAWK